MDKVELANQYFSENFLCSQAVLAAYAQELGLTEEQALKVSAGFGSGMCKGEVCGAAAGAVMAIGLKYGQCQPDDAESRAKTNRLTGLFLDAFRAENGSYLCKELLGYDLSDKDEVQRAREAGLFADFCPKMVASAAKILGEILSDNP